MTSRGSKGKWLIIALLVCRVFTWELSNYSKASSEITEWLKDKIVICMTQSSNSNGWSNANFSTTLTIIAEVL
jgi:hypothetical protein